MSKVTNTILVSLGYRVLPVQTMTEPVRLELNGVEFKQTFSDNESAWKFAEQDLTRRTHRVDPGFQIAGPDYQGGAKKLGFEVTVMQGSNKHGWRNRDLDVCSLRHDYTEAEAWRAAYMWARRFAILWKE